MSFDVSPYLGKPFDAETWNCWTLVATVLTCEFGVKIPIGRETLPTADNRDAVERTISQEAVKFRRVAGADAFTGPEIITQPGDIVTLRIFRHVCHVGIMHSARRALHVLELTETYLADLTSAEWKSRISAVYRHPELSSRAA